MIFFDKILNSCTEVCNMLLIILVPSLCPLVTQTLVDSFLILIPRPFPMGVLPPKHFPLHLRFRKFNSTVVNSSLMLTWPQNSGNPISEDLNFKNFSGMPLEIAFSCPYLEPSALYVVSMAGEASGEAWNGILHKSAKGTGARDKQN